MTIIKLIVKISFFLSRVLCFLDLIATINSPALSDRLKVCVEGKKELTLGAFLFK